MQFKTIWWLFMFPKYVMFESDNEINYIADISIDFNRCY
jgi:hypothetical protein